MTCPNCKSTKVLHYPLGFSSDNSKEYYECLTCKSTFDENNKIIKIGKKVLME